jgi:plasmid stabilization system protein ParE
MKLRYERGALSDLDEIFSYIANTIRKQQVALSLALKKWRRGLPRSRILGRRPATPDSDDFRLENI